MIAEGFSAELLAWFCSLAGLAMGAGLGARMLWRGKDARQGGALLLTHLATLYFAQSWVLDGAFVVGSYAGGAIAAVSAGWIGSALGRIWTLRQERPNARRLAFEIALGLAIGAPWFVWFAS